MTNQRTNAGSPLEGVKVLDLSQAIAGPMVGRVLADLGADVVKVEWSNGDITNRFGPSRAGITGLFLHMNAGKRGISVDRTAPGGTELLLDLAAKADVVVENFRPGVLNRWGLGYGALSVRNPALVMVSISGFGATSPESQRQAYAPVLHAEAGLVARQAAVDHMPMTDVAVSLADEVSAMHASIAVLAALNMRHRTGTGQHIDLSMLEALIATDDHTSEAIDGRTDINDSRGYVWDVVGGPLLLSADPRTTWTRLSAYAGLKDPTPEGASVETKVANRREAMRVWLSAFTDRDLLKAELERANIAWADVRNNATLFENASLRDGRAVTQVDDHAGGTRGVVRMPYRFSGADSSVRGTAPRRGQHNRAVLAEWLGASDADIAALAGRGVLQSGEG